MHASKKENSQGKALFGSFDFLVLSILLPFFLIVSTVDEMFYENVDYLRLASGAILLFYVIKKIYLFCVSSGDGILTNLIASATSMFLSYLFMFPLAGIMNLKVPDQLLEYIFSLLVIAYVFYNIFYAEKLKTGNIHLGWKGWCTKSIKILFQGVAAGVALILVLKLAIAFFSLINISVATFFNLFGVVFIVMIFSALLL